MYDVYTDGACLNNGSPEARGGMGIYSEDLDIEDSIQWTLEHPPTNQRTEMMAVALALSLTKDVDGHVQILSDSEYVVRGLNEWMEGWKLREWRTSKGREVKNRWLWELLDSLNHKERDCSFVHVRGHVGIAGNEKADELANRAAYSVTKEYET